MQKYICVFLSGLMAVSCSSTNVAQHRQAIGGKKTIETKKTENPGSTTLENKGNIDEKTIEARKIASANNAHFSPEGLAALESMSVVFLRQCPIIERLHESTQDVNEVVKILFTKDGNENYPVDNEQCIQLATGFINTYCATLSYSSRQRSQVCQYVKEISGIKIRSFNLGSLRFYLEKIKFLGLSSWQLVKNHPELMGFSILVGAMTSIALFAVIAGTGAGIVTVLVIGGISLLTASITKSIFGGGPFAKSTFSFATRRAILEMEINGKKLNRQSLEIIESYLNDTNNIRQ